MTLIQTALTWGVPPTTMLYGDRQPGKWTKEDKKLATAYQILENERCQYCGQYVWICRSSDQRLGFSVRTDICYVEAELGRKENADTKTKPGEHPYAVPYMAGDVPLPTRAEFYESLKDD